MVIYDRCGRFGLVSRPGSFGEVYTVGRTERPRASSSSLPRGANSLSSFLLFTVSTRYKRSCTDRDSSYQVVCILVIGALSLLVF
jgi:hypothetical protein